TREEQVAFAAVRDLALEELSAQLRELTDIVKAGAPKGAPPAKSIRTVRPIDMGLGYSGSLAFFGSKPHECSRCGEVFMVDTTLSPTMAMAGSFQAVTCPACGRTERYNRF